MPQRVAGRRSFAERRCMSENLNSLEYDVLQQIIEAFELAWQAGSAPVISDFLGDERVPRRQLLRELIHTDLEYRCRAGENVCVENYFDRFPEMV